MCIIKLTNLFPDGHRELSRRAARGGLFRSVPERDLAQHADDHRRAGQGVTLQTTLEVHTRGVINLTFLYAQENRNSKIYFKDIKSLK